MMKSTIVGINSWTKELLLEIISPAVECGPFAYAGVPRGEGHRDESWFQQLSPCVVITAAPRGAQAEKNMNCTVIAILI